MPRFFMQSLVLRPLPLGVIAHTDWFKRMPRIRQGLGFAYPTAVSTLAAPRQA
jgi:hypothetical protein